jgi:hypothetical protein
MKVAEKSCAPGQSIHHEAGMMNPAKVLNALLAADGIGIERRLNGKSQRLAAGSENLSQPPDLDYRKKELP